METWFAIISIVCLVLFLDNISKGKQIGQMKNGQTTVKQQQVYTKKPVQNNEIAEVKKLVLSLASDIRDMQRVQIQRPQPQPQSQSPSPPPPPPPQNNRQPNQSAGYNGRPHPQYNNHPRPEGERNYI